MNQRARLQASKEEEKVPEEEREGYYEELDEESNYEDREIS